MTDPKREEEEFEMHPDDAALEAKARSESAKYGDAVARHRMDDLVRLLTTYPDSEADESLANLREWFWATALPDAVKKGEKR